MGGLNVNGRVREALRDIGLTEYEALAYIALVSLGEITAIRISEAASIPYSKIYGVLEGLKKRGWIGVKDGRPKTYFPRSPIDALRSEKMKMENKFQVFEKIVLEDLQPLFEQVRVKERPEIWIIRGDKNIVSNIIRVVKSTRNRLMMAVPTMSLEMHQNVLPLLRQIQGVDIKLLMTEELFRSMGKYALILGEVRTRDEMFGGGLVADERECLIFLGEEHGHLAIWSDDIGLTTIARVYFEHLWETAKPTIH
ncbi:MAG: helix-turn-helix domain-containing protein [Candidatus Bathyarchaeia archaeon]